MSITIKEVDRVEILTLQDNYIDIASGDSTEIIQRALPVKDGEIKNTILAEHGFSALVTVTSGDQSRCLLFDFGLSEFGAAHNAKTLNADLIAVEVMALSHGHRDHMGGLGKLAQVVDKKGVEFVVHPVVFRSSRYVKVTEDFKINFPAFTREMIKDAGLTLVETKEPYPLLDGSILFLGDWVCLHGGTTFYMPAVTSLGMQYAGAAVIQSHAQVDYAGGVHGGEPIFVVVDLKKTKVYDEALHRWRHTVPGEIQGGAYNARAESDTEGAGPIFLPFLAKAKNDQGVTSLIAVRNNSNCNKLGLKLEVRKGTGTMITYVHNFWLSAGHVRLIDFADLGNVNPGFAGSGTIEITDVEQLCDLDNDGQEDQEPVMPSVVVVNRGAGSGDITAVYKGIRGGTHESP